MSAEGDRGTADNGCKAEDPGDSRAEAGDAKAKRDAGAMQGGGCDQEAEARGQGAGGTQFTAMGMTMEEGEDADDGSGGCDRQADGGCHQQAKADDRSEDRRFDEGQGDACDGEAEATAIIETKAAGTAQSARPPIWLAQTPTATMARIWSAPKIGCEMPAISEPWAAGSRCAKAGLAASESRAAVNERRFNMSFSSLYMVDSRRPEFGPADRPLKPSRSLA